MKCYSLKIIPKRIKQIPRITIVFGVMLAFIVIYCIVILCHPGYQRLDDLQDCEITIDRVNLRDSHDTKGSRMKLEIVSEKTTYYVWYPQSKYLDYVSNVEKDLLSGNVISVKIKIANKQSIRDYLFNQKRVVDIRSGSAVYYDLDTEMIRIQYHRKALWILFFFMTIVLLCYTISIPLVYGVIKFK